MIPNYPRITRRPCWHQIGFVFYRSLIPLLQCSLVSLFVSVACNCFLLLHLFKGQRRSAISRLRCFRNHSDISGIFTRRCTQKYSKRNFWREQVRDVWRITRKTTKWGSKLLAIVGNVRHNCICQRISMLEILVTNVYQNEIF